MRDSQRVAAKEETRILCREKKSKKGKNERKNLTGIFLGRIGWKEESKSKKGISLLPSLNPMNFGEMLMNPVFLVYMKI